MRIPDPKANTTTEAYLAYKAGFLEESELKPVLYEPYLHFDAWLAYWAGLATDYPHGIGKNLASETQKYSDNAYRIYFADQKTMSKTFTVSFTCPAVSGSSAGILVYYNASANTGTLMSVNLSEGNKISFTITLNDKQWNNLRNGEGGFIQMYRTGAWATSPSSLDDAQIEEGSTATPYEPYTKIPEMLTDEEALVAYLSGATDTYPEEIKDPYDVRIVGYLKHLASIRWPEPDYPVNNEEFYLSTMEPTHTSNSEPSADIELDTAEGKIISVEAYGDTKQNSYTGEQLLAKEGLATPVSDNAFWAQGGRKLRKNDLENGWTHIVNNPDVTSTQIFVNRAGIPEMKTNTLYTIIVEVKDIVGSPTLRICQPSQAIDPFKVFSYDDIIYEETPHTNDTSVLGWDGIAEGFYVAKLTTKDTVTELALRFWTHLTNNREVSLRTSVLEGDHSSDWRDYTGENWQPYVGGIPAPNPDYPQTVQVVTGEQTVDVTGKNLFNADKAPDIVNLVSGVTFDENTYTLSIPSSSSTSSGNRFAGFYLTSLQEGATYTFSYLEYTGSIATDSRKAMVRSHDGSTATILETLTDSKICSFTVPVGSQRIEFFFYTTRGTTSTFSEIQLERGSTATTYEPYQSYSYSLSLGLTELCKIGDYQDYIYKSGDDWYVHKEVRHLSLAIAEMNNSSNYPGWTNLGQIKADLGIHNDTLAIYTPSQTNISGYIEENPDIPSGPISINTTGTGTLYLRRAWYGQDMTQEYWQQNYPNLVVELYYRINNQLTDTKITDTALVGQLEALAGADTYDGKTYIMVVGNNPNLPALLKVEAYKY